MEETRKSGDLWSGVALGALGTYIVVQSWQWDYLTPEGPGPGFFPLWYGVAMVALAAALVVINLRRRSAGGTSVDWTRVRRALLAWLALAVAVALFKPIGFLTCFALLTFFIVAFMYRRPPGVAAGVAVAGAAGFYLVFPLALGVSLPVGFLGF